MRQGIQADDSRRGPVELSKNQEDIKELTRELDIRVKLIYRWRTF